MEETNPQRVLLVLTAACLLFYAWTAWVPLFWVGIVFAVIPLISDQLTRGLATVWMTFAEWIGTFNSKVLLTILFYLALTPIALLFRLFTNPRHETEQTAFYTRNDSPDSESFQKMW
ncbi:MAG: SxtJ family membrane protein [bacterium]